MKITVEQEKPMYKPITITLETAQEYFELLAALSETSVYDVKNGMKEFGLLHLVDRDCHFTHEALYRHLRALTTKVKETL